jgi:hypothetical protein
MVQEKERFLGWNTEPVGMKTRQAAKRGPQCSYSPPTEDISNCADALSNVVARNSNGRQTKENRPGRTDSADRQGKHVEVPSGTKPKGVKHSPLVPSDSVNERDALQFKETVAEPNPRKAFPPPVVSTGRPRTGGDEIPPPILPSEFTGTALCRSCTSSFLMLVTADSRVSNRAADIFLKRMDGVI